MNTGAGLGSGLLAVVLLDLVLAGDNAVVIAMAAGGLPPGLRRRAMLWGALGAVAVRIVLTVAVVYLLKVPALRLVGGCLLLPVAWQLLAAEQQTPHGASGTGFWGAVRTIVLADVLMGLDNVLAIAGAAHGHIGLVVLGLLISVPLILGGSGMVMQLLRRWPWLVYLGAAVIVLTAVRMMTEDALLAGYFDSPHDRLRHGLSALLVFLLCGGAWLRRRRYGSYED